MLVGVKKRWWLSAAMLIAIVPVWGQYTDLAELQAHGGPQEFARRQKVLAQQVQKGYVLLFARTQTPESAHYREDNDFFYFTGIADPGSVLLINTGSGEVTLFEPDEHLHFRIEDTVRVTENGPEILTSDVPKEMTEIETLVGSAERTAAGEKKQ